MGRTTRSGRSTAAAVLMFWFSACYGPEPAPTRFSRGAKIPLGQYLLTISDVESIAPSYFGAAAQLPRPRAGETFLAVFVTWDHKGEIPPDEQAASFMVTWILGRFRLEDGAGNFYRVSMPMEARMFRAAKSERGGDQQGAWEALLQEAPSARDWVVVFTVPEKTRGFTVLVDNLDWVEGQPHRAAVPLGR